MNAVIDRLNVARRVTLMMWRRSLNDYNKANLYGPDTDWHDNGYERGFYSGLVVGYGSVLKMLRRTKREIEEIQKKEKQNEQ